VGALFVYDWQDQLAGSGDYFGLLTSTGAQKPSYTAFQTAADGLSLTAGPIATSTTTTTTAPTSTTTTTTAPTSTTTTTTAPTSTVIAPPCGSSSTLGNKLSNGSNMYLNQNLQSSNGEYILRFQCDQNLVLYGPSGGALWASNTYESNGDVLRMQQGGNLVMYNTSGAAIWATYTSGHANYLMLLNDGNVVVCSNKGKILWATNT